MYATITLLNWLRLMGFANTFAASRRMKLENCLVHLITLPTIHLWEPLKPGIERWVYNLGLEPISVKLFLKKVFALEAKSVGALR